MFSRIFWSIVLVSTLYVLGVFFFPTETDELADAIDIRPVNQIIRNTAVFFQKDLGNITVNPLEEGSGIVRQAQDVVDKTKAWLDTTRQVVGQKAEQVQKVVDSVGKATDAIGELKQNVSDLTSLSGTISTTSGASSSGSSGSGIIISNK